MSLRPLNKDPRYMSGEYKKMFDIDSHQSNDEFSKNPYVPGKCKCLDTVCFSLTKGAIPCLPNKTKMLVWNAEGVVTTVPLNFDSTRPE